MYIVYARIKYGYNMLKSLFSSANRIKILSRILLNPGEELYLRQFVSEMNIAPRQVNIELNSLVEIGLLNKRISGRQHYFSANQDHILFEDLRNIFLKTVGLKDIIIDKLGPFGSEIDFIYIYGSFADGTYSTDSDIDLMIIGNIQPRQLAGPIRQMGEQLKREVNFTIFPLLEYQSRLKNNDHFIKTIHNSKKQMILGGKNELGFFFKAEK